MVGERMWPTLRVQGARPVLPHRRRAVLPRRAGPDQPDLALRPVRAGRGVSSASQPDWYMGWLDGALRLMPGVGDPRLRLRDPQPVLPRRAAGRASPSRCCTPGRSSRPASPATTRPHHLLDRPRDRPGAHRARRGDAHLLHGAASWPARPTCSPPPSACRSTPCCGPSGSLFVLPRRSPAGSPTGSARSCAGPRPVAHRRRGHRPRRRRSPQLRRGRSRRGRPLPTRSAPARPRPRRPPSDSERSTTTAVVDPPKRLGVGGARPTV